MRRPALIAGLILAAVAPLRADDAADAEREARAFLAKWHDVLKQSEADAIRAMVAPEALITNPGGVVQRRDEIVAFFRTGDVKVKSIEMDELKVAAAGEAIVANYRVKMDVSAGGQDFGGTYRYTTVLAKAKGQGPWRVFASHGTPIVGE